MAYKDIPHGRKPLDLAEALEWCEQAVAEYQRNGDYGGVMSTTHMFQDLAIAEYERTGNEEPAPGVRVTEREHIRAYPDVEHLPWLLEHAPDAITDIDVDHDVLQAVLNTMPDDQWPEFAQRVKQRQASLPPVQTHPDNIMEAVHRFIAGEWTWSVAAGMAASWRYRESADPTERRLAVALWEAAHGPRAPIYDSSTVDDDELRDTLRGILSEAA